MRTNPFTRQTWLPRSNPSEKWLTEAQFGQLVVRLGLDDVIALGPAKSVTTKGAFLAQIINKAERRRSAPGWSCHTGGRSKLHEWINAAEGFCMAVLNEVPALPGVQADGREECNTA